MLICCVLYNVLQLSSLWTIYNNSVKNAFSDSYFFRQTIITNIVVITYSNYLILKYLFKENDIDKIDVAKAKMFTFVERLLFTKTFFIDIESVIIRKCHYNNNSYSLNL